MSAYALPLGRHWLLTLIVSILAVFAVSYFYFTAIHALESFDTGSCTPLALGSSGKCVSSLQALLNRNQPYPAIAVDGDFGPQTQQAVIEFQSAYHLAVDGDVASQTAAAINEFSPRPGILSYVAGFVNSQLALSAKLCVAALMTAVTIVCLLLRATHAGFSSLLLIRCALAGFIAASSEATGTLIAEAHNWVARLLCFIFIALIGALISLLTEMYRGMSASSAFADPPSRELG